MLHEEIAAQRKDSESIEERRRRLSTDIEMDDDSIIISKSGSHTTPGGEPLESMT